jgi:hypothetical protein
MIVINIAVIPTILVQQKKVYIGTDNTVLGLNMTQRNGVLKIVIDSIGTVQHKIGFMLILNIIKQSAGMVKNIL